MCAAGQYVADVPPLELREPPDPPEALEAVVVVVLAFELVLVVVVVGALVLQRCAEGEH